MGGSGWNLVEMERNRYRKPLEYLLGSFSPNIQFKNSKNPIFWAHMGPKGALLPYWGPMTLALQWLESCVVVGGWISMLHCSAMNILAAMLPPYRWGNKLSNPIAPNRGNRALLSQKGPIRGPSWAPKFKGKVNPYDFGPRRGVFEF